MRGIRKREDIAVNLENLRHLVKAAAWLSSLELPVRLIALPEGALQGFNDEVLDLDHVQFARECAIDIPGPETDALGAIAREYNSYIMAQAKAHHPDWPDRFFNVGFILDPKRRGRPQALQGLAVVSGRAFGMSARHLTIGGSKSTATLWTRSGRLWIRRSDGSAS